SVAGPAANITFSSTNTTDTEGRTIWSGSAPIASHDGTTPVRGEMYVDLTGMLSGLDNTVEPGTYTAEITVTFSGDNPKFFSLDLAALREIDPDAAWNEDVIMKLRKGLFVLTALVALIGSSLAMLSTSGAARQIETSITVLDTGCVDDPTSLSLNVTMNPTWDPDTASPGAWIG